jgi:DNA-binding GntR family transcriptional regulator
MSDTQIPRSSLNAEVVTRLRHEIVVGVYPPGTRLQERLLCERYGISRSPLREAYQVLATEGLLEISPNRGAIVSAPTPQETMANYVLLSGLEVLAIELACAHATDEDIQEIIAANESMKKAIKSKEIPAFMQANGEVHCKIVAASKNAPLIETHTVVRRRITRIQHLQGPMEHPLSEAVTEHNDFLRALKARDKIAAVRLLRHHLKSAEGNLSRSLMPP